VTLASPVNTVYVLNPRALHGGKVPFELHGVDDSDGLPVPQTLEDLSKRAARPFLSRFQVAPSIREELRRLGIHRGSVFPDMDAQAEYLREKWDLQKSPT
jgi:hypothetical protein